MKILHSIFRRIPAVIKVAQIICQTLELKIPFLFDNVGADTFSPDEERWMLECVRSKFGPDVNQSDLQTVGCGTIGRVYKYKEYAIKIKIPGVLERIDRDLTYIEAFAQWVDWVTLYTFYFHRKIRTVHESICNQNDFLLELRNGIEFGKQMRDYRINDTCIFVPTFYPNLSDENMIVSSFVQGVTIASLQDPRGYIREPVRDELHKFLLHNILVFPLCHADLHVGNLILERSTHRLAVIDFGMCMPKPCPKQIFLFLRIIQAAEKRDAIGLAKLISLEYYLNNDPSKCIIKYPDLYKDFEFEIVRAVHNSFDQTDLHVINACFHAAARWSFNENVWGSRDMANLEVAAVVSLTNLSVVGVRSDSIRAHAKSIMKKEFVG